jgi:hypothetical protein
VEALVLFKLIGIKKENMIEKLICFTLKFYKHIFGGIVGRRTILVRFVVERGALGQVFLTSPLVLPYQYHFTMAPYSLIYHQEDG